MRTTALELALGLVVGFPMASWAVSSGYMAAYEDGVLLAESSGGDVYNDGAGITEKIRDRDVRVCHYAWRVTYEDQTDRYGTVSGWQISCLSESGHGAADWRTAPKVCVDQNNELDACGSKGYINP